MAVDLKAFTPARVGIGRVGASVPTAELLRFQLDHARARDAVYEALDPASLGLAHALVRSAAADRATYLRRPDLGRRLADGTTLERGDYDAGFVIADGLSAPAVHRHARPLLEAILPRLEGWRLAPLTVVLQGRVAIGDEIGERLGARMVVMLIGERPGLTSPDSLGVYLTWDPRPGRTDAERNCISNIRPLAWRHGASGAEAAGLNSAALGGLSYDAAAGTLEFLMTAARSRRLSGVPLKDENRYLEH